MVSFSTFILALIAVHVFGILVGYKIGIYKGIEVSIKVSVCHTIDLLREAFKSKGLLSEFDETVKDCFDEVKLKEQ